MALKHLKNAIELLNAGMSINDIRTIITMKDEPEQETEENQETDEPEQEEETQDEPGQETEETQETNEPEQKEQATKPEVKKNPYQEKSKNVSSQETLVEELNKIF